MEWFNVFGFMFIAVIMIPNIIFAVKHKDLFKNRNQNKAIEIIEQIGRFGCFAFMIFNIPSTWFGWWSDEAFAVYLLVDTLMIVGYLAIWIVCWHKNNVFKALALSIIPAAIFLFSGIMCRSVLLLLSALMFAPTHVMISYKGISNTSHTAN